MKKLEDFKLKAFEPKKSKNIIGGGQPGSSGQPGEDSCEGRETERKVYSPSGLSFEIITYGDWEDEGCC